MQVMMGILVLNKYWWKCELQGKFSLSLVSISFVMFDYNFLEIYSSVPDLLESVLGNK